jgi:hypothetical protein
MSEMSSEFVLEDVAGAVLLLCAEEPLKCLGLH